MRDPIMFVVEQEPDNPNNPYIKEMLEDPALKSYMTHGWGFGYVALFKGHPWYGKDYEELNRKFSFDAPLTFSQERRIVHPNKLHSTPKRAWIIGFDTSGYDRDLESWPKGRVEDCTYAIAYAAWHVQLDFIHRNRKQAPDFTIDDF